MSEPSGGYANGTLAYRVAELERDVKALEEKVDKLIWAIVSLTIALATTSVVLVVTRLAEQSS